MPKGDKLTIKQEKFCLNLFQGMSQREAYVKAGYSGKSSPAALDVLACNLYKTPKISLRIAELQKAAEDASIMTVTERKQVLSDIGRARLTDFVVDGEPILSPDTPHNIAASEYSLTYTKSGEPKKTIKLRDPISAISELNKMEGIYSDVNVQNNILIVNGKPLEEMTDDELRQIAMKKQIEGEK